MSELLITKDETRNLRRRFLATASGVTLVALAGIQPGHASGSERPMVWIELGGQTERVEDGQTAFVPPFLLKTPRPGPETISPTALVHAPRYSTGGEAKISFIPSGTDWALSASVRYGRANGNRSEHQQSYPDTNPSQAFNQRAHPFAAQFIDMKASYRESHAVMDFTAGKDVGLGLLGHGSQSMVNFGVRVAQFTARSNIAFRSDPDWHIVYELYTSSKFALGQAYHSNLGRLNAQRSFHGVGPSLSWDASALLSGENQAAELALDWGVNAAILFGRQKANIEHRTVAYYHGSKYPIFGDGKHAVIYNHTTPVPRRSRSAVIPNIGGFAGVSFRYINAKISFGYRADFFFGAMDGGIDARKTYDRNFYGPFATISIGLGG